jgi:predicted metal-dependent hydrolase
MKKRPPQLALRLEAAEPAPRAHWRDGARLAYLGEALLLRLDTDCKEAVLAAGELHLPLPPEATTRQIQDAAESWLRARARTVIAAQAALAARLAGRPTPAISLSFAARAGWVEVDRKDGAACLRCHWRLIEQPLPIIAQVLAQAIARLPRVAAMPDLFALG